MTWVCYLLWVSLTSVARIYYNPAQQSKYRVDFGAVKLTCLCLRKQTRANWRLVGLRSNRTNAPESCRGVILKRRGSAEKRTWEWSVIHEMPVSLYLPGKMGSSELRVFLNIITTWVSSLTLSFSAPHPHHFSWGLTELIPQSQIKMPNQASPRSYFLPLWKLPEAGFSQRKQNFQI